MWQDTQIIDAFTRSNDVDVSGYTDAFTQGNEDPLSSSGKWTAGYNLNGPLAVVSNAVRTSTANVAADKDGMESIADVSGAAQYVKFRVKTINNSAAATVAAYAALRAAASPTRTYYQVGFSKTSGGGTNARCFKVVAGTGTQIGSDVAISNLANSDVVEGRISPNYNITLYINGVLKAIFDDATQAIASGLAGLVVYIGPGGSQSDLEVDTYEAGVPPTSLLGSNYDDSSPHYTSPSIVGNAIRAQILAEDAACSLKRSVLPLLADQFAQVTFSNIAGGAVASGGVRLRDNGPASDDTYDIYTAGTGTAIDRRDAGAGTSLTSEPSTVWAAGDTLLATAVGDNPVTITVYRRPSGSQIFTQVLTVNDGNANRKRQGQAGPRMFVSGGGTLSDIQLDDFTAGHMQNTRWLRRTSLRPGIFAPGRAR